MEEAEKCDRIAILNEGRIVSLGSVAEVKQSLGGRDLAAAFERAVEAKR